MGCRNRPEKQRRIRFIGDRAAFSRRILALQVSLLFSGLLVFGCEKEEAEGEASSAERPDVSLFSGIYELKPASVATTLKLHADGTLELRRGSSPPRTGRFLLEREFLRIYFDDEPDGSPAATYPVNRYVADGWRGYWREDVRLLYFIAKE